MRWIGHRAWLGLVASAALLGPGCRCKSEGEESVPDEGPMPELRTGWLEPESERAIEGKLVAKHVEPGPGALAGTFVEVDLERVETAFGSRVAIDGHASAIAVLAEPERLLVRFPSRAPTGTFRG